MNVVFRYPREFPSWYFAWYSQIILRDFCCLAGRKRRNRFPSSNSPLVEKTRFIIGLKILLMFMYWQQFSTDVGALLLIHFHLNNLFTSCFIMPVVSFPIYGCTYETPDMDPALLLCWQHTHANTVRLHQQQQHLHNQQTPCLQRYKCSSSLTPMRTVSSAIQSLIPYTKMCHTSRWFQQHLLCRSVSTNEKNGWSFRRSTVGWWNWGNSFDALKTEPWNFYADM